KSFAQFVFSYAEPLQIRTVERGLFRVVRPARVRKTEQPNFCLLVLRDGKPRRRGVDCTYRHAQFCSPDCCACSSIFFLKLSGRMSVQTSSIYARHSAFVPCLPTSFHPSAFSRSAGQIEYCSSWFTTTL